MLSGSVRVGERNNARVVHHLNEDHHIARSLHNLVHIVVQHIVHRRATGAAKAYETAFAQRSTLWSIIAREPRIAFAAALLTLSRIGAAERSLAPSGSHALAPALSVLPDFTLVADVDARKQQFFDFLEAYVNAENERLLMRRESLTMFAQILANGHRLSPSERLNLAKLALDYHIDFSADAGQRGDTALVEQLLRRVDAIPVSLVLAQAANESAWGTSRFAVDGNNPFGQWCYEEGCGVVPLARDDKASHEVRKFNTIAAAVSAYFRNINTHPSYSHFRRMRARMREQEKNLDPIQLAYGLGRYSQRGDNYIDEVQTIIQQNDLRLRDEG